MVDMCFTCLLLFLFSVLCFLYHPFSYMLCFRSYLLLRAIYNQLQYTFPCSVSPLTVIVFSQPLCLLSDAKTNTDDRRACLTLSLVVNKLSQVESSRERYALLLVFVSARVNLVYSLFIAKALQSMIDFHPAHSTRSRLVISSIYR